MKKNTKWLSWNPINAWSKLPNSAGIYEIKNTSSGFSYIGSAVALKRRGHYEKLSNGSSHNKEMQQAFRSEGENSFQFRILEFCNKDKAIEIEQKYIDTYDFRMLYNVAPIAGSTLGYSFTDSQREDRSKSKQGVPHSLERKKKVWLKKVERDYKQDLYARLFKKFKQTDKYKELIKEIKVYVDTAPGRKKPIILKEQNSKEYNLGSSRQIWWTFGDGREYVDDKFEFTKCDWRFINGTNASVNIRLLQDGLSNSKLYKLIAESVFHRNIEDLIESSFNEAVKTGELNLEYSPAVPDDSYSDTGFQISYRSKSIGRHKNGRLEYAEIGKDDTTARQEWYEDGTPKLSVLNKFNEQFVVKKIWHKNGQPESIMHFVKGELHGAVCKWDSDGQVTFARNYNHGKAEKSLIPKDIELLAQFKEVHDYSKYEGCDVRPPTLSVSLGFE